MRAFADCHTHTIYSRHHHGKGTIQENAEAALTMGLEELWITDHGPGHIFFGVKRNLLPEIRQEVDRLNRLYEGKLKIRLGVEANVMNYSGDIDVSPEDRSYLDRVNCGFHYGIVPTDLRSFFIFMVLNPLSKIVPSLRRYVRKRNTDALIAIIETHYIDIITHPGDKVAVDIKRLALAAHSHGTALEINASHTHMNLSEIEACLETSVDMVINSDAHTPERVGNVADGIERAVACQVPITRLLNIKED